MLNFILKILQSAKSQTGSIFFHLKISQLYIIMYFYVIQTVFKPFKNHKNQRSQIMLNFILKIYNLLKVKPDNIFSPQNSQDQYFFTSKQLSYIYIADYVEFHIVYIFMLSISVFKSFENHKNQRSQIMLDFLLKIYNLLKVKPDQYFFTSKQLSYI